MTESMRPSVRWHAATTFPSPGWCAKQSTHLSNGKEPCLKTLNFRLQRVFLNRGKPEHEGISYEAAKSQRQRAGGQRNSNQNWG